MAYSDAQREATERYNRKTYERIELKVKKGQKDYIQKAAAMCRQERQPVYPGPGSEGDRQR